MIRKVYTDLIMRKLREDGPGWLLRRTRQYLLLLLSEKLHRPLCGPVLGTLMVTYRCNLRCEMCDMPGKAVDYRRQGKEEFSTEQFLQIIREFANLGIPGIGFTGGEPLLREDIFELMAETRKLGMIAHLNSNGWLLGDNEADRIIAIGVDSVNISLDGASAATHDRIRRCTGSFDRAVAALQRLVARKRQTGAKIRIKTVAVLSESNIGEVQQMLDFGAKLGIDCTELIPRQPFFAESAEKANASSELMAAVDDLVAGLLEGNHPIPIENSPAHLRLFKNSFAGKPSPVRCSAGYNSLAVDCYGNLFPCVPWINWGKTTGTLDSGTLAQVWSSAAYQQQREKTGKCRDCYLNCQTELNLLFNRAAGE